MVLRMQTRVRFSSGTTVSAIMPSRLILGGIKILFWNMKRLYVTIDSIRHKELKVPYPSYKTLCLQSEYAKGWNSAGQPLIVDYEEINNSVK